MVGWHHRLSGQEFDQTQEIMKGREVWHAAVLGIAKSWTQLKENKKTDILALYVYSFFKNVFDRSHHYSGKKNWSRDYCAPEFIRK